MDKRVLVYLVVSLLESASAITCEVRDFEYQSCQYTVFCEEYAGSANNPDCQNQSDDRYVTFIITNSVLDHALSHGFFASTNFDSRVREIRAINNTWPILNTLAFRYYSKSVRIDLSNNGIQEIRKAFQHMESLQYLNISNNEIQNLNSEAFFITMENKGGSMEVLDLSNNKLEVLPGDVFVYLPTLKELYLENNKLRTLSNSLSNVFNLIILDISNNKISSLNDSLSSLNKLYVLNASNNEIGHIAGHETNRLVNLVTVNMSHNYIEFVESNCFNQAFNLLTVDLSHNRINSTIDSLLLINNNKLKYLNLCQNNITQIEDNAFKHTQLQYINVENNFLSGEITSNTFSGLKNITTLNLSYQNVSAIKKNAFSDAISLVSLNVSHNIIQFIENSLSATMSLKILDVSYNNISNIDFLRNSLPGLSDIYLQCNNISEIQENAFYNQTLLRKIDLSQNNIKHIQPNSLPLNGLQYLNLSGNRLVGSLNSNVFSPANVLRSLDLSNFKINRITEMALINMTVLARLNISNNGLEYINPNNFLGMDKMYSLDLSYNNLSSFHLNNSHLINLKALYLNNNHLSNISRTLINMTGLLYVDLSNNNISDLSDVPFTTLQNLKVLHLAHNKIKVFNNPQTNSLSKLSDLILSGNQMTEINLSYFRDLGMVDISKNKVSNINSSFFDKLDSIQSIDISDNNITQINPGTFQHVKILKFLNLSHNKISILRYGIFRGLNRTEVLDLSFNNLNRFEVDVFHECNELKILTIDYNNLKTLDIERLVAILPKLSKLSIGGNPLSCKEIVRNIKIVNRHLIRQVEVTSVDKIYHDDNVHGIKCGDTNAIEPAEEPVDTPEEGSKSKEINYSVVIWFSLLCLIFIAAIGFLYYRHKQKETRLRMESRLQLRNSMSGFSETSDNLLG